MFSRDRKVRPLKTVVCFKGSTETESTVYVKHAICKIEVYYEYLRQARGRGAPEYGDLDVLDVN